MDNMEELRMARLDGEVRVALTAMGAKNARLAARAIDYGKLALTEDGTVTATPEQWEATRQEAEALLSQWKNASHRSTEAEFAQLCDFLKRHKLERVGAFAFSPEEGTPAAKMD